LAISVFDIFKVGIGPSSSHTVGPMRAARQFLLKLSTAAGLEHVRGLDIGLFGSLGLTGRAHGTDTGILLGLAGHEPETVDPDRIAAYVHTMRTDRSIVLLGRNRIPFEDSVNFTFHRDQSLPHHPNGMRFTARGDEDREIMQGEYYSVGGGFVVDARRAENDELTADNTALPYTITSGRDFLALGSQHGKSLSEMTLANETSWRTESEVRTRLGGIADIMHTCIERGSKSTGTLPGGLGVVRRAAAIARELIEVPEDASGLPPTMEWVNVFALAVNEENACGGRVVTAPTNGAAGIVPAVLEYYRRFVRNASDEGIVRFLLAAGAVGILYKENASISGAEVGCQGEVGVACSMAAAGLAEALGATIEQVENAAEIGMEHNLGLTCDPVGGLVQIPCIERNAMGAVKAINAARLAIRGTGKHRVSLDEVIKTMRETGADMQTKYKESALGGLAVNVIEC